jgi:catechol 2,3-dioxygenase-like lactoylglutathione lyase family enzyme
MSTNGIQLLFVETHNWGKTVAFWEALGFKLEFETDHHSGLLRAANGTSVFVAEQSLDDPVGLEVYLGVADADDVSPGEPVDVVRPFTASHWGTQLMTVRDPDGRLFRLEAPQPSAER